MSLRSLTIGLLFALVLLLALALNATVLAADRVHPLSTTPGLCAMLEQAPDADPIILQFDTETAGTRIAEQYAASGLHFLNDYKAGQAYRSSPVIQANASAHSLPNVLVNESSDSEVFSSADVPLVIQSDQLLSGAAMVLGATKSWCAPQATISLYDCQGVLRGIGTAAVSSAFNTPLQVNISDTNHPAQIVVVDYGSSTCQEAIDSFAVQPVSGQCTDATPPQVDITSHPPFSVVNSAQQVIQGTITETGILKSVKLNGQPIPFFRDGALYRFSALTPVPQGSSSYTVLAQNGSGGLGADQVALMFGQPTSVSLSEFHLTQRGVMKQQSCDADAPFVTGKSPVIRINLDVRFGPVIASYVSTVEMKVYRDNYPLADILVGTYMGETYSSQSSMFSSPSHMSGIHFWVPAYDLDTAGQYKFTFQPYIGQNKVGGELVPSCGPYFQFDNTHPVKLYIVPAEAGSSNPHQTPAHTKAYFTQLDVLERTYPVREGVGWLWVPQSQNGILYGEGAPFRFCDGSAAMMTSSPKWCKGTGWTWTFIERDAGGTLRRTGHQSVPHPTLNDPDQKNGGIELATMETMTYTPQIGIFRGGGHPGDRVRYNAVFDEDNNGTVGNADRLFYIKAYFDADNDAGNSAASWIKVDALNDLNHYDIGETMRFFWDQDGDEYNNEFQAGNDNGNKATQAPITRLWDNVNDLLFGPAKEFMNSYNLATPGTQMDANFVSLWFPILVHPHGTGWFFYGPGQGTMNGPDSWIRVVSDSTMAHELGHNAAGLGDLYEGHEAAPDDLVTKEKAWTVYVNRKATNASQIFAVMGSAEDPDEVVFIHKNYQALFNKLLDHGLPLDGSNPSASGQQFSAWGRLGAGSELLDLSTSLGSGLETTPANPDGDLALLFGQGTDLLHEHRFSSTPPTHVQGDPIWESGESYFDVVVDYPAGANWVELRLGDDLLARRDQSSNAPWVTLTAPSGGSYGAHDEVMVQWDSGDDDGDDLLYSLHYSPNGGENWIVVASGLAGTEYAWYLGDVPGTPQGNGLLKVVASDGFNSGEAVSDEPIEVAGKPPLVAILSPGSDDRFLQCERVFIKGAALDPEDDLAQTTWFLDGEALDAGLQAVLDPLPPGPHHLVLQAFDNQGLGGEDDVAFEVIADTDCDGMDDDFEMIYGLELGWADDAALDGDNDGLVNFDEAWWHTEPDNPDTDGDGESDGREVEFGSDPLDADDVPPPQKVYLPLIFRNRR